jgi:HEAT repeat protein
MRALAFVLLLALPVAAQGMGPPVLVEKWKSKKNQQRLRMTWDALPDDSPIKLPDGTAEPPKAPWPFVLYVVSGGSKSTEKIERNIFEDTRFRLAVHACRVVRARPEKALDLRYLAGVAGIKDPTLIVFGRDFEVVGILNSPKEFTAKKLLPLMAKAADREYQVKLRGYVSSYIRILKTAEKLWKEELALEDLATRAGGKDKAKRKQMYREIEEREAALQRAEDDLLDEESALKGSLVLRPEEEEALPTTVGSGKRKRELTPAELEAVTAFRSFARDSNPDVRAAAVEDLGAIDSGFLVEVILKAANDVDLRVVHAAGAALSRMRSIESLEAMHVGLRSGKQRVRVAALLGFAGAARSYPPAVPDLIALAKSGDDEVRRAAIQALGPQRGAEAGKAVVAGLSDSVPALRVLAATVLGQRKDKAAAPALLALLDSKDWSLRKAAVESLGKIRTKESIGPLVERFQVVDGLMREVIYKALVAITGQDFRYRAASWKRWWDKYGPAFKVPTEAEIEKARKLAAEALRGYAKPDKRKYHTIETLSKKMVFVIDISSSMRDKIVIPGDAPDSVREAYPDRVKMEIAKREMISLLTTLDHNVYFNIITFAGRVKPWEDTLVPGSQRNSAIKFVSRLKPVEPPRGGGRRGVKAGGGIEQKTNTYGALMEAFGLADAAVPNWRARAKADTIFLVTDGVPTIGKIIEVPKLIRAITEMNKTRGVIIHVITFDKVSGRRLRKLAEDNGGTLLVVPHW